MNSTEIVLLAVSLSALVGAVAPWVAVAIKKRGVDVEPTLDKAQSGLEVAQDVVDGVAALNPKFPGVTVVDKIIQWAKKFVDASEQLVKSQQIAPDQRKAKTIEWVKSSMTSAGIKITPDLEKVIDGSVEAAVNALPKTGDNVKAAAVAALTSKTQSEAADAPVTNDVPVTQETPTATPAVTVDQLNQAQTIISAAIAEKTAAQVPTECESATPDTTGAGQASV